MTRPTLARWLSAGNDVTATFLAAGQVQGLINMGGGLPEADLFPVDEIAGIAARVTRDRPAEALGYGPIAGLADLRALIAERNSGGDLRLGPENVLVTTSGMQALDLVGKVLIDPGRVVAVQTPTYLGALDAFRPREPFLRPMLPHDDPGWDAGEEVQGAALVYTVPNFSNPTGRLVPEGVRANLVAAARVEGTWLVEDDPYRTLLYDSAPVPRMLDLAAGPGPYDGPVIYLGTLSKELVPGLRIGWIIAGRQMIEALTLAKQGSDMCTSGLTQLIALEALRAGLDRVFADRAVPLYRARRDALLAAMQAHLSRHLEWEAPVGGMFVWARVRTDRIDTDAVLREGLKAGVCVSPSSVFDPQGRDRRGLRINFTLNPPERLAEGVRRLARVLDRMEAEP